MSGSQEGFERSFKRLGQLHVMVRGCGEGWSSRRRHFFAATSASEGTLGYAFSPSLPQPHARSSTGAARDEGGHRLSLSL